MKKLSKYQITKQIKIFETTVIVEKKKSFPQWVTSLMKLLLAFGATSLGDFLITKGESVFVKLVPDNEAWSIAVIALPVAIFGIYLPLLISMRQKFSTVIADKSINDLYDGSLRMGAVSSLFVLHSFSNLFFGFLALLMLDYAKITAYSLFVTFDLIILIFCAIHKIGVSFSDLYAKYIVNVYLSSAYHFKSEANCIKMILQDSREGEHKFQNATKQVYEELYAEIKKMYLSIISKPADSEEKRAMIKVFQELTDMKLKKVNVFCIFAFLDLLPLLYDSVIKKQDYSFIISLTDYVMLLEEKLIKKITRYEMDFREEIKPLLDNRENSTISELKRIEEINQIFQNRLRTYSAIILCVNKKISAILSKLKEDGLLLQLCTSIEQYELTVQSNRQLLKMFADIADELEKSNIKVLGE